MMRTIIVASDACSAEAVRRALRYAPTLRVAGWVAVQAPCSDAVVEANPDVVIVDDSAGVEPALAWSRGARTQLPGAKIVLLLGDMEQRRLAEASAAGADAAIAKTGSSASVGMLVREVAAGNVMHFAPRTAAARPAAAPPVELTSRELEILRLVAAGRSNSRIAKTLWVTEQTVKFHLSNVYRKLGLANRTEAAHYAHLHGLVEAVSAEAGPALPVAA